MQQGHRTIVVALSHTADIDNAHLRFVPDSYRHIDERQRLPFVSPAAARLLGYHLSDIHLPDVVDKGRALRLPIKAGPCPLTRRRHIMGHQVAHRTEISINLFVRDRSGGYAQLGTDCVRYISKANAFFRRCMITSTALKPFQKSEEHTSELQSLMRISYAVFCLKTKKYT